MSARTLLKLLLCAPSGAGKTTLKNSLLVSHPELMFSVSHTTRPIRSGEVDGRDYHFIDEEQFRSMIREGRFLEWAEVHGNLYGTSRSELERAEDRFGGVIFDLDYQGARQLKAALPEAVGIFILPPSFPELRSRLEQRGTDSEEVIARRLAKARVEVESYPYFDYLVINDRLEIATKKLDSIITAELCRRVRQAPVAETILRSWT